MKFTPLAPTYLEAKAALGAMLADAPNSDQFDQTLEPILLHPSANVGIRNAGYYYPLHAVKSEDSEEVAGILYVYGRDIMKFLNSERKMVLYGLWVKPTHADAGSAPVLVTRGWIRGLMRKWCSIGPIATDSPSAGVVLPPLYT